MTSYNIFTSIRQIEFPNRVYIRLWVAKRRGGTVEEAGKLLDVPVTQLTKIYDSLPAPGNFLIMCLEYRYIGVGSSRFVN